MVSRYSLDDGASDGVCCDGGIVSGIPILFPSSRESRNFFVGGTPSSKKIKKGIEVIMIEYDLRRKKWNGRDMAVNVSLALRLLERGHIARA